MFQTPPLLAVKVVSPESVKHDYRFKRSEYAALLIPEYWIVDPLEDKVTILLLVERFYDPHEFTDERIVSQTFPEFALTAEQVLQAGTIAL